MTKEQEKILTLAKKRYKAANDAEEHNYLHFDDAIDFIDLANQWPDDIKAERDKDGRPCLVINKAATYIRQVVNDQLKNSPSMKVFPADDKADPKTAKIINGLLRSIEQVSGAEKSYDLALSHTSKGGFGFLFVEADYLDDESFDQDILIRQVKHPQNCFVDPNSEDSTGSDGDYCFMVKAMPKAEFENEYKEVSDWDTDGAENHDWYQDDNVILARYWEKVKEPCILLKLSTNEIFSVKNDEEAKTVTEQLAMQGIQVIGTRRSKTTKVIYRLLCGHAILEEKEWPSRKLPLIRVIGNETYYQGKHYTWGLGRDMMDPARMYNYWRTATTEQVALATKAPWVGPRGFAEGMEDQWEEANRRNLAYLEYNGDIPPQRQPFSGTPIGALQETMSASEDIKAVSGIFDASLGARSNETSGVAIDKRKMQGDQSTFNYKDNLAKAIKQLGKVVLDMMPRIYDSERIIRILNPDNEGDLVPINHEFFDQETGKFIKFDLSLGKYDVIVDTGPSFMTQRQEAVEYMMEFIRAYPAAAPVIGDLIVNNMDWPGSEDVAERLRALLPPQLQGQNPQAQMMEQQIKQMSQAIQMLQSELQREKQKTAIETRKLEIDEYEAETDRIDTIKDLQTNEQQVQQIVLNTLQNLMQQQI